MAIIIVAPEVELHADWIEWGLKEAGFAVIRWAGLGWRPEDSATIYLGDREEIYLGNHKLSSKDTVWFKRPSLAVHPEVDPTEKKFAANEYEAFKRNLLSHIELSGARCINKWSTVLTIENKSLQLSLASRCGLRVPATRIGNCAPFIKAFLARPDADIIHKAFRPHAWIGADGAIYNCETTGLSQDCEWLDDTFAYAPGVYQQRIQKNCDVRVNMIGGDFHSFVITTPGIALDWRSHGLRDGLRIERITLPLEIESALRTFADRAELAFGCFDMVVDSAGVWWFLEVNQAGQFLWIDDLQPDDGVYEPMLRFLSATEPASDRGFPSFRRCLAECKVTEEVIPPEEDFPFRTVEKAILAAASSSN
ncbi:MAG TPA: hypothetical protein VGL97_24340 [Bryobacteraceae bacterium]|jgi:hypothetical protein